MIRMISITARTFDPLGAVQLQAGPDSDMLTVRRRASRVATLDGGAVVNDMGHSVADRTLSIDLSGEKEATVESLRRMVRLYAQVTVGFADGVFIGVPSDVAEGSQTLTILILEKLSA